MPDFIVDSPGPGSLSAVFEDEDGVGYLYVFDERAERVLIDLPIYNKSPFSQVGERDVAVLWSVDGTKCGVSVLGKLHGVIDVKNDTKTSTLIDSEGMDSTLADAWLEGFDLSGFVVYESFNNDLVGFFEDDIDTGYLYVYHRKRKKIVKHLQVYTRVAYLGILRNDVRVLWAEDGHKCGVAIWGALRGIIDLSGDREGRILVESKDTPPIVEPDWVSGFDLHALEVSPNWAPISEGSPCDAVVEELTQARRLYWKDEAKRIKAKETQ